MKQKKQFDLDTTAIIPLAVSWRKAALQRLLLLQFYLEFYTISLNLLKEKFFVLYLSITTAFDYFCNNIHCKVGTFLSVSTLKGEVRWSLFLNFVRKEGGVVKYFLQFLNFFIIKTFLGQKLCWHCQIDDSFQYFKTSNS